MSVRIPADHSRILGLNLEAKPTHAVQTAIGRLVSLIQLSAPAVEAAFTRAEWNFLASATNGFRWDVETAPGWALKGEVEDAREIPEGVDVDSLIDKINALDAAEAETAATALRWFWDNHETIDSAADRWWTLSFRRKERGAKS